MAYSREIIKKVLQYVRFRVPQTEEKNSYYTEIGNTLVRISNHCTRLRVYDEILEKNPKWKGKPIISIVFEDDEDTFDEVDCLVLKRFRMKPIKVTEYVYRLQGDPQFITPQDERLIISGIKQVQGGKYTDLTNKCSEPILRVSQNPPNTPLNNKLNCNLYMNKKLIRLTESDLHRIVKESVYSLLEDTKPTNEGIENETSFLPHLKRTYENLYREYEHWQYATYKPQGMDDAINAIIAAMHSVQDIIRETSNPQPPS